MSLSHCLPQITPKHSGEMTFFIVFNSTGQLDSSLSLSWAHSSINPQLQVEVSQLSAGLRWPQPGQLGQPGCGWHVSHLSRLAWCVFMAVAGEEERKPKWAKAF